MPTATVTQNSVVPYDPSFGLSESEFNAMIAQRNALSNPNLVTNTSANFPSSTVSAQTSGGIGSTYNGSNSTTTTSGGGGESDQERLAREQAEARQRLADETYGRAMSYAQEAENMLRGLQPQVEGNINSSADLQRGVATTTKEDAERSIETTGREAKAEREDVVSAARRALQESNIGFGQRFGRGSDMARALGEYSTVGFQRASGQASRTLRSTLEALNNKAIEVKNNYANTIAQIEQFRTQEIAKAQQAFQQKLLDISSYRGQAENERSAARVEALVDLNNTLIAIQDQAQEIASTAATNTQSFLSDIGNQIAGLGSLGTQAYAIGDQATNEYGNINTAQDQISTVGGGDQVVPTGQVLPQNRDEEDIFSAIRNLFPTGGGGSW